jgi:hypothetical protein
MAQASAPSVQQVHEEERGSTKGLPDRLETASVLTCCCRRAASAAASSCCCSASRALLDASSSWRCVAARASLSSTTAVAGRITGQCKPSAQHSLSSCGSRSILSHSGRRHSHITDVTALNRTGSKARAMQPLLTCCCPAAPQGPAPWLMLLPWWLRAPCAQLPTAPRMLPPRHAGLQGHHHTQPEQEHANKKRKDGAVC